MKKTLAMLTMVAGVAAVAGFVFLPHEPLPPGPAVVAFLAHFLG